MTMTGWFTHTQQGGREGGKEGGHTHTNTHTRARRLTIAGDDDGHDEPVDPQDTRHDDRDDVSHDQAGVHDTHGTDAHAGLGRPVGGAQVCVRERRGRGEEDEYDHSYLNRLLTFITNSIVCSYQSSFMLHACVRDLSYAPPGGGEKRGRRGVHHPSSQSPLSFPLPPSLISLPPHPSLPIPPSLPRCSSL